MSAGVIANLTEQRMAEQMAILEKFYNHYDSQQWHAVIEMEGQVRDACAVTLTCAAIMLKEFCENLFYGEHILYRSMPGGPLTVCLSAGA